MGFTDLLTGKKSNPDESNKCESDYNLEKNIKNDKSTFMSKVKTNISKKISDLGSNINKLFTGKSSVDNELLDELEELLIMADLGPSTASQLKDTIAKMRFGNDLSIDIVKQKLSEELIQILSPVEKPLTIKNNTLEVLLFCGINGAGKTTTIGKLVDSYLKQGKRVVIASCDTFRAAADDQLSEILKDMDCKLFIGDKHAIDPASVAYKAMSEAKNGNYDILIIDTAGRLHNQINLMEELSKLVRVIKKIDSNAPSHNILVLDATLGQNSRKQLEEFNKYIDITGLIVTKLDTSSKGGILVGLAKDFAIPIHYIGLGEKKEDLKEFSSQEFVKGILSN